MNQNVKRIIPLMVLATLNVNNITEARTTLNSPVIYRNSKNLINNNSFEKIKNYIGNKEDFKYWKNKIIPEEWTGIWVPNKVDSEKNYIEVINNNSINGEKAVLFHSEDLNTRFSINQEIIYDYNEADKDKLFSYEANVKTNNIKVGKGVYLRLQFIDKNGTSIKQIESNVIKSKSEAIQKLYLETKIPENTHKLRFVIFFDRAIGDVVVDDINFKVADIIELENKDITILEGEKIKLNAITEAKDITWESSDESIVSINENNEIVANSIGEAIVTATIPNGKSASSKVKVINKFMQNIIENGSFEEEAIYTGTENAFKYWKDKIYPKTWDKIWVPSQPKDLTTGFQLVSNDAYDGEKALLFVSNDNNSRFSISKEVENPITIEDLNSTYKFSLKAKLDNVQGSKGSSGLYLRVQFLDKNNNKIDVIKSESIKGTTENYETVELTFNIPDKTKKIKFEIFCEYFSGKVLIDDAKFSLSDEISFDKEAVNLNIGEELKLEPKYQDGTLAKYIEWSSSNDKAVSVYDSGKILALRQGRAVITAKLSKYNKTSIVVDVLDENEKYYEIMKDKWFNRLTGNNIQDKTDENYLKTMQGINNKAEKFLSSMNKLSLNSSDTRETLWDDLDLKYNFTPVSDTKLSQDYNEAFSRVRSMALAYSSTGSKFYKDQELKKCIIDALNWLYDNLYNEKIDVENKLYGNWWHWQIGIPQNLCETLLLMAEEIDAELYEKEIKTLKKFSKDPNYSWTVAGRGKNEMTGANLTDRAYVSVLVGVLSKDYIRLYDGIEALKSALKYVEAGDGFYKDGSFIQHKFLAYTAGYGAELIIGIEKILFTINDTPYELDKEIIQTLYEWILKGYKPLFAYGSIMDMTAGRGVARPTRKDQTAAKRILIPISLLIDMAEDNVKYEISRFVKEQVSEGLKYNKNYLSGIDMLASERIKKLIKDESVDITEKEEFSHIFAAMDKVTHHTKDFSLGISMFSNRTSAFEYGNYENTKGYHMSDGALFLYNGDRGQFADDFYQTVDYMRLPGITTDHTEVSLKAWQPYYSSKNFVGGSNVLNKYASVAMDFDALDSSLEVKKSWFLFDEEVVALGAGISSNENKFTETIVENRKIKDNNKNKLVVDGKDMTNIKEASVTSAKWAFLDGNTGSDSIGYYFPDDNTNINILREARTYNWTNVNDNIDLSSIYAKDKTKNYLSMSIPHSNKPKDEKYSYVLLPNKNEKEVEEYSKNPNIKILSNTEKIQAVENTKLNVIGINFWEAGTLNGIESKTKSSVTIAKTTNFVEVGISDPTMKNEKTILEIDKSHLNGFISIENDENVIVRDLGTKYQIEVKTKNTLGKTHIVRFL